jgi:HTH-type transcriptional regulator / antitoxin HigA
MAKTESFLPMWASPPGRTIQTRLDELGYGVPEFARSLGTSVQVAAGLLDGGESITLDLAGRLSRVIGASVEFWVNRDCQYRDGLMRVETDRWLEEIPVREMAALGWISPKPDWESRVEECLSFFGVRDVDAWHETYEPILSASRMRISPTVPARKTAVAAWLRKATVEADASVTEPWNPLLLEKNLPTAKSLTWNKDPGYFLPRLRGLLAASGVTLVVQRALPGCPVSGAARFLSPDRAMVAVSGRFLTDDQFWFTVMHEVGHLLLHGPQQTILDDPLSGSHTDSEEERQANQFASDLLLPPDVRGDDSPGGYTYRSVISMARKAGVAPGIIVGQLQFESLIGYDQLNRLKRHYQWRGANLEMA